MAGLWGAKNFEDRALLSTLGNEMFDERPRKYWDFDQVRILEKMLGMETNKINGMSVMNWGK